jgi:hypothetical protein
MRAWLLVLLLSATSAGSPVCSAPAARGPALDLVLSGPASGTVASGSATCRRYTISKRFDYFLNSKLNGKDLVFTLVVYSTYSGPGTYPVGSLLDGAGELRLSVGTVDVSTATGAGTLTVNADGRSGSVDADLSGGEHVKGTFACDHLKSVDA